MQIGSRTLLPHRLFIISQFHEFQRPHKRSYFVRGLDVVP